MQQEPLPTNAISTLIITDFLQNELGEPVSITLHRRLPEPAKGYRTLQPSVLPDGPPKRLPSALPPAGNLRLTLSIRDLLGDGRCGTVYTTDLRGLDDSTGKDLSSESINIDATKPGFSFLPELVIKVADQAHLEDIANEAALYDEMENLQGVAIPLCYGWFHAELPSLRPRCTLLSHNKNDTTGIDDGDTSSAPIPTTPWTPAAPIQTLSILLLERMGDFLPLGKPIPNRSDLWDIFSDLSQLGIDQPDMRYSNILLAPSSSFSISSSSSNSNSNVTSCSCSFPSSHSPTPCITAVTNANTTTTTHLSPASNTSNNIPPKLCPYHHRPHAYRLIDFDRARKTDWTLKQHHYMHVGTLGRLLEMLEMGIILEPWEC